VTPAVGALGLLLLLVGLAYATGDLLLLRRVRGAWTSFAERFVFAVPLGFGVVGFLIFALGLVGLFRAPVFVGLFALGVPGLGLLARDALAARKPKATLLEGPLPSDLLGLVTALVLGLLAFCTLIGALAPPGGTEWDALSYHLAVPKTYLREGRIFYIPYDHHSNFPFLVQMHYTAMLAVGSETGAKLVHWLCGVLCVAGVYAFAARHYGQESGARGRRIAQIAALVVAAQPILLWEATIAYVDLATALYTWLSIYALFNAAQAVMAAATESAEPQQGASVRWLVLSAVLMGFALGTKLTVLGFWGILLLGILGWHLATTGRWAKETIPHAALWGGLSFLIGAPWLIKSYVYTGSPVYPFYYRIFGGRYWNAENAAQYERDQALLGIGKSPVDFILAPWQAMQPATAGEFNEYGWTFTPVLVGLLLAAPFVWRRFSRTTVSLALFGGASYLFWFLLMQQARYFLPVLLPLAVVAAEAFVLLWEERRSVARYLAAALVAASALWAAFLAATQFAVPAVRVVTGQEGRAEYVTGTLFMRGAMPATEFINRSAPPDAKVALFDYVFGYYLDREYLWATPNHAYGLLPWDDYAGVDEWLADFKQRGITYLLVDEANRPREGDPLAGQRWRSLLAEAVAGDKVEEVFAERSWKADTYVRVYRIP
jgi:4-amino-4-deoxy-L-arabinose transferase and related glycosyltransferases of PMT family